MIPKNDFKRWTFHTKPSVVMEMFILQSAPIRPSTAVTLTCWTLNGSQFCLMARRNIFLQVGFIAWTLKYQMYCETLFSRSLIYKLSNNRRASPLGSTYGDDFLSSDSSPIKIAKQLVSKSFRDFFQLDDFVVRFFVFKNHRGLICKYLSNFTNTYPLASSTGKVL